MASGSKRLVCSRPPGGISIGLGGVGSSSKETTPLPFARFRVNTTVRELGAQDASSPATKGVTDPPPAGTAQSWKPPMFAVNMIVFPSGDQSGSVQLSAPSVRNFRL